MAKTQEEIAKEIAQLDEEIAQLEQDKRVEELAALVKPLAEVQKEVVEVFKPFQKACGDLRSIWKEIESILSESEAIIMEAEKAREQVRAYPEEAPTELRCMQVPVSLLTLFPHFDGIAPVAYLRRVMVLTGRGEDLKISGRRYIISQLRQGHIKGLTFDEKRALAL